MVDFVPLLAKTMAVKPHMPLRIVIRDGRIVMYFNLCFRTRRSKLSLVASVFNLGISCTLYFQMFNDN
jgi:hypothetical protein